MALMRNNLYAFYHHAHHHQDFLSVRFIYEILFTNFHFSITTYHFFMICLIMC